MATSFNVNKADLEFILKQIQLAESTSKAYTATPLTILQAIQNAYNVSASDAAILPFGLRTVDGSDNNLLPGQTHFGAADNLFPRLLDPRFRNEADGDQMPLGPPGSGAPTITNNNYGLPGQSVADADPRIISNLIVDMTPANPAAVEAALRGAGYTGNIAAARTAIVNAYNNIATTAQAAHAAQLAENAAQLALYGPDGLSDGVGGAEGAQAIADAANDAAQATLAAYNDAIAENVETKVNAAQDATDALVNSLAAVGSQVIQADRDAATVARVAAEAARDAAQAAANDLLANLGAGHADVVAAQTLASHTADLVTSLASLELSLASTTPNLDTPEFNAAGAANTLASTSASAALSNTGAMTTSQGIASANATAAAEAAANALTARNQDQLDLDAATLTRDSTATLLVNGQTLLAMLNTALQDAQDTFNAADAANLPFRSTLAAYDAAVAAEVHTSTANAHTAMTNLVTELGAEGDPIDTALINAIDSARLAADQAADAAASAVTALQSDPNVAPDDLDDAQTVAANSSALKGALDALHTSLLADADLLVDAQHVTDVLTALNSAGTNATDATTLQGQLTASQSAAHLANQPSADILAQAAADLMLANNDYNDQNVLVNGDPNDPGNTGLVGAAAAAQAAYDQAVADLVASESALSAANAADTLVQATLDAYNTALAEDVEVKTADAQTAAANLVALLGSVGSIIDAVDMAAAAAAVAAALSAANAAADARDALLASPNLINASDLTDATTVASHAADLLTALTALETALGSSSPLLDL